MQHSAVARISPQGGGRHSAKERHVSQFEFPYKSFSTAHKGLGEDEFLSCAKLGWYQKQYRKRKNSIESAILERAQSDPRFKDIVDSATKEATAAFAKP